MGTETLREREREIKRERDRERPILLVHGEGGRKYNLGVGMRKRDFIIEN